MPHATELTESLPFGLRRKPFQSTADPDFFFSDGQAGEVLGGIVAALRARRGIFVLTGEPGTGKTTVLRRALDELAASGAFVPICGDAPLDLRDLNLLLGAILPPAAEQLGAVEGRLGELAKEGWSVVLAIDDAHSLEEDALDALLSLLQIGSASGALASLVLVGEPALVARLEVRAARGDEIAFHGSLEPLRFEDVDAYIAHRSHEAGGEAADLFSAPAVERIADLSSGVPRFVNLLCREALAAATLRGARRVETDLVDAAVQQAGIAELAPIPEPPGTGLVASLRAVLPRQVAWAAMGLAAVAVLVFLPWLPRTSPPLPLPPPANPVPPLVTRPDPPPRAADAVVEVAPRAVEPGATARPAAEAPTPGPRVALPLPPDRRSDTRDTARSPARSGDVHKDARIARAPRNVSAPSPVPGDREKGQALLLRVENGDLTGVAALLSAGESPDVTDRMGLTPLMLAAIRGDAAIGRALLQRGARINTRNQSGQTALMMAAINNHRAVAAMLLDRRADVNARTADGWTALTYAAWEGHPDMARLLLARGADASLKDRAGWTAQRYAAWRLSPPTTVGREGVVTGIDNVEPSRSGTRHSEVLRLLTESRRR